MKRYPPEGVPLDALELGPPWAEQVAELNDFLGLPSIRGLGLQKELREPQQDQLFAQAALTTEKLSGSKPSSSDRVKGKKSFTPKSASLSSQKNSL